MPLQKNSSRPKLLRRMPGPSRWDGHLAGRADGIPWRIRAGYPVRGRIACAHGTNPGQGAVDLIVTDPAFCHRFYGAEASTMTGPAATSSKATGRSLPGEVRGVYAPVDYAGLTRVLSPAGSVYVFYRLQTAPRHSRRRRYGWAHDYQPPYLEVTGSGCSRRTSTVTSHYHILYVVKRPEEIHLQQARPLSRGRLGDQARVLERKEKDPDKAPAGTGSEGSSGIPATRVISVFDPFLGSGTVAVVAQQEGRHFPVSRSSRNTCPLHRKACGPGKRGLYPPAP